MDKVYQILIKSQIIQLYISRANGRNRIGDLLLTMELLYRLSYIGKFPNPCLGLINNNLIPFSFQVYRYSTSFIWLTIFKMFI